MAERFTVDGDDRLEKFLSAVCDRVGDGVRRLVRGDLLEGVLLGGGYGRGEGGVLRTAAGDRAYNDLEFYILARGHPRWNEWRYGASLRGLAEELSRETGLEVEFKISSKEALRRARVTMYSYDLVVGHRWICGDDSLLADCGAHAQAQKIPLSEATRLMMNRCSGLLFAWARLQKERFTADDADFVGRNLAKAGLGLGDAVLTAVGEYDWSCRERARRLAGLELGEAVDWLRELAREHRWGVEFKLHPCRTGLARGQLCRRHGELCRLGLPVWLWVETRRLGIGFRSAREYALCPGPKCPEYNPLLSLRANVRAFGWRGIGLGCGRRYPRERLLNSLAILLWEPNAISDAALWMLVKRELRLTARTWRAAIAGYAALWKQFS